MATKKKARSPTKKKSSKTIKTRVATDKKKVLEIAETVPFLGAVANKTGVSRATIYRWANKDGGFADRLRAARVLGRENVNDMAESGLVKMIQKESLPATRFWLENNHDRYRKHPSLHEDDRESERVIPPEHVERINKALAGFKKVQKWILGKMDKESHELMNIDRPGD